MMEKKRSVIKGAWSFLVMAGVLVVLLSILNWFPTVIWPGTVREYASIEAVQRELGLRDIPLPTYFPENITWPPSRIIAQEHPYPALGLEFSSDTIEGNALVITRTPVGKHPLLHARVSDTDEVAAYDLGGKKAELRTGTCNGTLCSLMVWDEGGMRNRVLLLDEPFELIEITRSMHQ